MAEYYNNQEEDGVAEFGNKEKQEDLISSEFQDKVMVSDQPHHNSFSSPNEEEYFENAEEGEEKSSKENLPASAIGDGDGYYGEEDKTDDTGEEQVEKQQGYGGDVEEEEAEKTKEKLQAYGEGNYDEQDKAEDMDSQAPIEKSPVDEEEVEQMKEKIQAYGGDLGGGQGNYDEQDKAEDIDDSQVPVEKSPFDEEEVENMKEKLQGYGDDLGAGDAEEGVVEEESTQQPEKKGFLDKIKDKIHGYNSKPTTTTTATYEEEKEESTE